MEIENDNKKEKKKFSLFCCFSTNCGRNNSRKKEIKGKLGQNTVSTNVINKSNISNNSIKNKEKYVKEFYLSNEQEQEKKEENSNKENIIYSNNSNNTSNNNYNKNKNTFTNENNNMNFSVISEKINIKNKSINALDNINKKNIYKNTSNKTYKTKNNKILSNNETSLEKGLFEEKSDNKNNEECIKYENNSETYSNDNVNIYDNNNRSYNNENEIKNKKSMYKKKDSYVFNYNIKNNYYPTDFNLNLTSDTKKNNINSVINFEPKINLSVKNFIDNKSNCDIQNKDDTIIMKQPVVQQEISQKIITQKTGCKLYHSKSYNNLNNKKNNLYNLDNINNININNRSGIFFINLNDIFTETKIKFGFKYEKIPINITEIKNNDELDVISITKEKNMTFNVNNNNKSPKKDIINIDNNLLKFKTEEKINKKNDILSKSQQDFDNIEYKLNYIDENYFKDKNNTNIIKKEINEINNIKENIDTNNNNINKNTEKEKENNLIVNNILDLEGDIESADDEEESKKINDSKSIISNYIVSPLLPHNEKIRSNTQSIFSRTELNFNFREFKENISNFNEIMSNKGSFIPNSNYNETEIEIMNENGKEFCSFIETPRASGVYNKKIKNKNTNYNFNMTNTYNFKNMNLKIKKIKDKINQNAKDIQKTNEKINKLDEQIKEYENCSKQYEMWIEKEEEESEILINMINFLNSNRK